MARYIQNWLGKHDVKFSQDYYVIRSRDEKMSTTTDLFEFEIPHKVIKMNSLGTFLKS